MAKTWYLSIYGALLKILLVGRIKLYFKKKIKKKREASSSAYDSVQHPLHHRHLQRAW